MPHLIFRLLLTVTVFSLFPVYAHAMDRWNLPLEEKNWQKIKVPGQKENQYAFEGGALTVRSDGSVSFRYMQLPPSIMHVSHVSWDWLVQEHSALARQSAKASDDRPLAVHIWFNDQIDASLFGRLGSAFGYPKVGHLLTYVWGAQEAEGSVLPNPHYDKGKIFVLVGPDGATQQWTSIRRDIRADYIAAFGTVPDLSKLRYIAISADSDDLDGRSVSAVKSLSVYTP